MEAILEKPKVEKAPCLGDQFQDIGKRVEQGVNEAKAAFSAKLEEGKVASERLLKRGRYVVEDGIEDTAHTIKRNPFNSVAIAFAAGAVFGLIMPRFGRR